MITSETVSRIYDYCLCHILAIDYAVNYDMEVRPKLAKDLSVKDFRDFYWYKEELVEFCRSENLDKGG
ncbi:hypothetical protein RCC89_00855 [Cytophagaceae bacterium ABcell3]|nr:hypothetical protein RCC89_00855 [Cytophagaceae bacterium ABcell3]